MGGGGIRVDVNEELKLLCKCNKKLAASKAYSMPPQGADQNPVN